MVGSELVISKGGVGNLEAYMESGMKLGGNALFLLRVKCKPFVRLLGGVPMGRPIIISSRKINELSF